MRTTITLASGAALALLAGCASVPSYDGQLERLSGNATEPRIIGVGGPLSPAQSRAVLAHISHRAGAGNMLQRHLAIERAVADTPLVAGNRTRVLRNGPEALPAIFSAIHGAKHSVNMEYYILEDVESGGRRLSDLLLAKRKQGIAVNVIYDSFGSIGTADGFFNRLRAAGVNLLEFHPVNPLDARGAYAPNDRDHRKILVVDGRTAILGGVNLSTTYESNSLSLSGGRHRASHERAGDRPPPDGAAPAAAHERWRDTDIEIEGPAVTQLQGLFLAHWAQAGGKPLDNANFFPVVGRSGNEIVRIVGSSPADALPRYYVTLLSAIRNAEQSIWLSAAYFVPTHDEMEALEDAARRGVDVRLILPDHSDSQLAIDVAHSRYEDLLEAGVKIFETHDVFLHSKTVVIDNVWSAVGSSNFDQRSVLFNDEVDAIVLGEQTAREIRATLEHDLRGSRQIERAAWRDRPFGQKIQEYFARIWETLL